MSKQVLRKEISQVLLGLSAAEIATQSQRITACLQEVIHPQQSVACFMSMDRGEVDTQYILQWMFSSQQCNDVYLPRCTHTKISGQARLWDSHDRDHPHLTFHRMESLSEVQSLKPSGKYRLREPKAEDPAPLPPLLDIILVPGVAFNVSNGGRMGWGVGYYDDFFKRYKLQHSGSKPLLVGLALKQQLVGSIEIEPHDHLMDCIVSGDGKIHWMSKP